MSRSPIEQAEIVKIYLGLTFLGWIVVMMLQSTVAIWVI
jgi:hypothetical protein